jgi:cytochrome b561
MWRNTLQGWGLISILIHWLSALAVFALFALGWWMTGLTYYDAWYNLAPWWHRSAGMLLLAITLLRVLWRLFQPTPQDRGMPWEMIAAHVGHWLIYALLFVVLISGYLISTAEGSGISVFGWFSVPALVSDLPDQATLAGEVHWYSAWALLILSLGHVLAAYKHHLFDRNDVLRRMVNPRRARRTS